MYIIVFYVILFEVPFSITMAAFHV